MNTEPLKPADEIHFLRDGLIYRTSSGWTADSEISRRGQTIVITDKILDANRQADGSSFLDLVDDEDAQVARWGSPTLARGAAPTMSPWIRGDANWEQAREHARKEAHGLPTVAERQDALAEVRRVYGAHVTSKTLNDVVTR